MTFMCVNVVGEVTHLSIGRSRYCLLRVTLEFQTEFDPDKQKQNGKYSLSINLNQGFRK